MFKPNRWFGWSRSGGSGNGNSSTVESPVFNTNSNTHSLEQLKLLYRLLEKNQTVSENNRTLLVETLRQIAEILIWGDQNDSSVFDFFLEKNMLYFFLNIMKQKCGGFVCTQLLQTLNILFENIKNETSLYYLLSNNHVNSIIIHKFDFSDEEVMAYYISFLKTLSLKLNVHTIHFFFNEHTADFPLYTEAIKFFNHSEKMVRIAVRTLTLNVFRVREKIMLKFIRDCTAAPYFSNLSWFIGNHILDLNNSLQNYMNSYHSPTSIRVNNNRLINRLEDLIAEHLDHLHYLNDILLLNIDDLNTVLSDNLLYRLIIPLYIHSFLSINYKYGSTKQFNAVLSPMVALFLLTQAFLIISFDTLLQTMIMDLFTNTNDLESNIYKYEFIQPNKTLEAAIEQAINSSQNSLAGSRSSLDQSPIPRNRNKNSEIDNNKILPQDVIIEKQLSIDLNREQDKINLINENEIIIKDDNTNTIINTNNIDWQHCSFLLALLASLNASIVTNCPEEMLNNIEQNNLNTKRNTNTNIEHDNIFKSCHSTAIIELIPTWNSNDDRIILFGLSLILSIISNKKIDPRTYENIFTTSSNDSKTITNSFSNTLLNSLLMIMRQCSSSTSPIRLVTFELAVYLFKNLTNCFNNPMDLCNTSINPVTGNIAITDNSENEKKIINLKRILTDHQLALLEQAREDAGHLLRQYYCSIDKSIFVNIFEQEAKIFYQSFCDNNKLSSNITSPLPFSHSTFSFSSSSNLTCKSHIWSYDTNLTLEQLFMDATLLLPPNAINIDENNFHLRLPAMDYERARYIIQVFLVLRFLSFDVRKVMGDQIDEKQSNIFSSFFDDPKKVSTFSIDNFIDLENCELNACSVTFFQPTNTRRSYSGLERRDRFGSNSSRLSNDPMMTINKGKKKPRFMVLVSELIILIDPDDKRYGCGIIRFIARIQDIEKIVSYAKDVGYVTVPSLPEKDDNKSLYLNINCYQISSSLIENRPGGSTSMYTSSSSSNNNNKSNGKNFVHNNIVARLQFNDTVRSIAAKRNLDNIHKKVLDCKMLAIAQLIDFQGNEPTGQQSKTVNHKSTSRADSKFNKNNNNNNNNQYGHQILSRSTAVPGVAVQTTKFTPDTAVNNMMHKLDIKKIPYTAAQILTNKTKLNSTKYSDNDRKKKKFIFNNKDTKPLQQFSASIDDNDGYGLPLNDLSPKTIRKKFEFNTNESISMSIIEPDIGTGTETNLDVSMADNIGGQETKTSANNDGAHKTNRNRSNSRSRYNFNRSETFNI